MAEQRRDEQSEPTLELPSLFKRRKRAPTEPGPTRQAEPPAPQPAPQAVAQPATQEPAAQDEPRVVDQEREFKLPPVPGRVAAAITGLLVGILATLLTWGSLETCEAVRGTASCGGPGFFLLLVILALMIAAGALLLAAWDVADPKSTSALGVGLVCILVLLVLIEELLEVWMFVVVPAISALAYVAAHWVTTALIDEDELER